jgi:ParB family chromosome partitioning protein
MLKPTYRISPAVNQMVKKNPKGLGLGLEALLGPMVDASAQALLSDRPPTVLSLDALQPGKYQPRTRMDEGSLYELAESIKAQGIMQPVLVRPVSTKLEGDGRVRYEIIAGERRVRAARLAGLSEIPVLVKDVPDESAAAMALIENIQREDLNPLEEAQGIQRLVSEFMLTHEQAAQAVGRSRSAASNLLRLLNLAVPVQDMLMAGDIDMGHARALLGLEGAVQILAATEISSRKLSVREAEKLVARTANEGGKTNASATKFQSKSRDLLRIEETLSDHFAAAVEIRMKKRASRQGAGELAIAFDSLDELDGLLQKFKTQVDTLK